MSELISTVYTAPHTLLRFVFLYILGTNLCRKPSQATFLALSFTGLGHALETSIFQTSLILTTALDAVTIFTLLLLLFLRHHALTKLRPKPEQQGSKPSSMGVSDHYTLFVIGSGGHTAEMLSMIERSIRPQQQHRRQVRRYVISHGDTMSVTKVQALEANLATRFKAIGHDSGTYDIKLVARARMVHQSWLSTPASFAKSIFSIIGALYAQPPPSLEPKPSQSQPRDKQQGHFPGVIVTNGPATAFAVVLVSHVLRMLRFVPETHMHAIYVESFAKVSTLSLTGKLLYLLDLADQFVVQWPKLHHKYPRTLLCPYFSVRPAEPLIPGL